MQEYDSKEQGPATPGAQEKRCSGPCGRLLPPEAFVHGRNTCKACLAAYHRAYYEAHKQQVIERAAAWGKTPRGQAWRHAYQQAHRSEKAAYDRAYRAVHAERIATYLATYRGAHRPQLRQSKAAYHRANAQAITARAIAWQRENRARHTAAVDRYAARHPLMRAICKHNRRSREQGAEGAFSALDIRHLYAAQHGRCGYCGCALHHRYHIDHMTPLSKQGSNWPANLCLACGPCNRKKACRCAGAFLALLIRERRHHVTV